MEWLWYIYKVILPILLLSSKIVSSKHDKLHRQGSKIENDEILNEDDKEPINIPEAELSPLHSRFSSEILDNPLLADHETTQVNVLESSKLDISVSELFKEDSPVSYLDVSDEYITAPADTSNTKEKSQCSPHRGLSDSIALNAGNKVIKSKGLCVPNNKSLVIASELAISYVNSFKDSYTLQAFGTDWNETNSMFQDEQMDYEWLTICDSRGHCAPVLPQLPPYPYHPPSTQDALKLILIQLLGHAQRYMVSLNSLILDQSLDENNFLNEMMETERNMAEVISVLMSTINDCYLQIQEQLILELISKFHNKVDKGMAYRRGFRVLRQCLKGLHYFTEMFPYPNKQK